MKSSVALVAVAFLCLVAFPSSTVGKNLRFWPKPVEGWPSPSEISRNEMFLITDHIFNYGDSKVWKCTYSNGSAPAISISPSIPYPSTPSTPSPSTPSTPSPTTPPPTPKASPPPTPKATPPPTPKATPPPTPKATPPPTPKATPPPTPKVSPPPTPKASPIPTPKASTPPTIKKSPTWPVPSLPPPTPKKSPSPSPPSHDQPSSPPPENHHGHNQYQNQWEHIDRCMRNMGHVAMCRGQMEMSFYTRMFKVSDYCCNLVVNMENECDDVAWGFFTDPFFVPLVRCTCHVTS